MTDPRTLTQLRSRLLLLTGLPRGVTGALAILDPTLVSLAHAMMSPDEAARVATLRRPQLRPRRTLALALTRVWLADQLGVSPSALPLERPLDGPPRLSDGTDLQFSISHSGDRLVIVASSGQAVGVDIERVRARNDLTRLVDAICSPEERQAWGVLEIHEQMPAFYALWTAKEALLKAHGWTLADGMSRMPVHLDATFCPDTSHPHTALYRLDVGSDYVGALALRSSAC